MECPRTPEMRGRAFTSTPPRGPLAPPFQVADETQLPAPINDAAGNPNQAPLGEPAKPLVALGYQKGKEVAILLTYFNLIVAMREVHCTEHLCRGVNLFEVCIRAFIWVIR